LLRKKLKKSGTFRKTETSRGIAPTIEEGKWTQLPTTNFNQHQTKLTKDGGGISAAVREQITSLAQARAC
jgi:hypothetical protein